MTTYTPDAWVILKIIDQTPDAQEPVIYKVLAGWYGGYLNGDSWKINSGITDYTRYGDRVEFKGYSNSVYQCGYNCERFTGLTGSIFESFSKDMKESCLGEIKHISFEQFEKEFHKKS
jgi:hypothetical protein